MRILILLITTATNYVYAAATAQDKTDILLWLAIIIIFAIISKAASKIGQSFVLGQLLLGIGLRILAHFNIMGLANMPDNQQIAFFAELGSIFLLLEIGLESSLTEIMDAGKYAISVALIGVIVPFILGYFIVVPFILHSNSLILRLFFGSMLAVTSTGVSVSVFKELGILKSKASQIVLAASVIDDISGLILLSITTGLAINGNINLSSLGLTLFNTCIFFTASVVGAKYLLPYIIKFISKINNNNDTITLIIFSFCLLMAYTAGSIGLAFIIGAFLAGLLLYPKLFQDFESINNQSKFNNQRHQLEALIAPYGKIFTPLFFIYAGMQVDIISIFNYKILISTVLISIVAIIGKLGAGVLLPKNSNRLLVGIGMIPRGEIGLIFAITGLHLKIIDSNIFAIILLVIIITSIVTPIAINYQVNHARDRNTK